MFYVVTCTHIFLYYITKTDGTALSENILYFTVDIKLNRLLLKHSYEKVHLDTGLAPTMLS